MIRPSAGRCIWSWLHISDIHVGHGSNTWHHDQRLVLASLVADLPIVSAYGAPKPDAIICTGDVAVTGGLRDQQEYAKAIEWIERLRRETGSTEVFCVPGNHDVQRTPFSPRAPHRMLYDVRSGREALDEAYADVGDNAELEARFANYSAFLDDLNFRVPRGPGGSWSTELSVAGRRLRLIGLNTAVLCNDEADRDKLRIGRAQLAEVFASPEDVDFVFVLGHHPTDWLYNDDKDLLDAHLLRSAHLYLHGHIHSAATALAVRGSGHELVTISAGAVHTEQSSGGGPLAPHAYSIGCIWEVPGNGASIRVWPRQWSEKRREFLEDVENVPSGQRFAEHPIHPFKRARRTASGGSSAASIGTVADRLIARIGDSRTAFPIDMSIAELSDHDLIVPVRLTRYSGGTVQGLGDVAEAIMAGANLLVLGPPGAGKTVLTYQVGRILMDQGWFPLVTNLSRLSLESTVSPAALVESLAGKPVAIAEGARVAILLDGVDEALAGGMKVPDLALKLGQLCGFGSVLVTCRQREFETQLAPALALDLFGSILQMYPWRVEHEFASFVARLVTDAQLPNDSIVQMVRERAGLRALVERPLLARMLTFVVQEGGRPTDLTQLYQEYLGRLGATTAASLARVGCFGVTDVLDLWRESAWHVFRDKHSDADAVPISGLLRLLRSKGVDAQCAYRVLTAILEVDSSGDQPRASFVHYSFFEFLVALYIALSLARTYEDDRPEAAASLLSRDLPREIRRHLTGLLRRMLPFLDAFPAWLAKVYRASGGTDTEKRTSRNLIAYIGCRLNVPANAVFAALLDEETDPFLQNSLLWALARGNDMPALIRYIVQLTTDSEFAALNRGYLLYYYGDLSKEDPPYSDLPPYIPWSHTRGRLFARFSESSVYVSTPEARQVIDLYTFLDLAACRGYRLTSAEEDVIERIARTLASNEVVPELAIAAVQEKLAGVRSL